MFSTATVYVRASAFLSSLYTIMIIISSCYESFPFPHPVVLWSFVLSSNTINCSLFLKTNGNNSSFLPGVQLNLKAVLIRVVSTKVKTYSLSRISHLIGQLKQRTS